MAVFAITFRIEDGPRWDERYDSLIAAIEAEAKGTLWKEPTSFYLLVSSKNSADLKDAILANSDLNSDDVLVVINISATKGHASHGISNVGKFRTVMDQRS